MRSPVRVRSGGSDRRRTDPGVRLGFEDWQPGDRGIGKATRVGTGELGLAVRGVRSAEQRTSGRTWPGGHTAVEAFFEQRHTGGRMGNMGVVTGMHRKSRVQGKL